MQFLGWVADVIGILGGAFAFFAWIQTLRLRKDQIRERERLNGKIRVILSHGGNSYELPFHLRRSELTRAELLGRIGMIPIKRDENGKEQKRFAITHFNSREFFERLNNLALGDGNDVLVIPCEKEEFEQFELKSSN